MTTFPPRAARACAKRLIPAAIAAWWIASALPALADPTPGQTPPTGVSDAEFIRTALARSRALRAEGRNDEAITVLQEAVTEGPYDENMNYLLGQVMERHATPEAMIEFFSKRVDRDPKPQTSQYFWAVALARKGDNDGAIVHLRKALEIDPAHELSQRQWGLILEKQGRPKEALEHLVEATRIHPEFKTALLDAARVAKQLGRTAEAAEYERRAANATPGTVRQFVYWARYLHEHGRNREALAEVDRMLAQQPADPEALKLREQIRAALGTTAESSPAPAGTPVAADAGDRALSAAARAQLVAKLSIQPEGTPAWITYDPRDASAGALARQIAGAFEEARWTVRKIAAASFPIRPGVFLMAADDPPSDASSTVADAFAAIALEASVAGGYRAYADERRRADAGWRGFVLEPDQDFVIAIGRRPDS